MVKELKVEGPKVDPTPSWETRVALWHEMVYDEIPLPQDFVDLLTEQYAGLISPTSRGEENKLAWGAYNAWAGDISDDPRTPGERLNDYFAEQEAKVAGS